MNLECGLVNSLLQIGTQNHDFYWLIRVSLHLFAAFYRLCWFSYRVPTNKTGQRNFSLDNNPWHSIALSSWFRECLHNWCWPWSSKPSGGLNKAPSGFNSHTFPLYNIPRSAPNETHWQSLKASTQCQTHQFLWFYFFDHHNEYTYISFFGLELSHNWCAAACFYKLIQLCF